MKRNAGVRGPIAIMRSGALTSGLCGLVAMVGSAAAQTALEDTVRARFPEAEYRPIGVDLGLNDSFLLFPKAVVAVTRTDNLFRDGTDRIADEIVTFAPSVDLKSDWDNHALDLSFRGEIARVSTPE